MLMGQELTFIPDIKVKVGEQGSGDIPKLQAPIIGMTLDFEINSSEVRKFSKIEKDRRKWYFAP
jgi:hypothetical protein